MLIAFAECHQEVPEVLERWRSSKFGKRVFIISKQGAYVGDEGPYPRQEEEDFCWTFTGMTSILKNGFEV